MTGLPPHYRTAPGLPGELEPIESVDDLVAFMRAGCKREGERRLGIEYERLPLRANGTAAPYQADGASVRSVLEFLAGTGLERVDIEGNLLMLRGEDIEVHLEPGAQVELVLPPLDTAQEIRERLDTWHGLLVEAASVTGVHVVALGMQPVTPVPDIAWIPKGRYAIMRDHLGARGRLAHHMMKATAAVQLNVDFTSEEDAAGLVKTALALSPLVNALSVNSPLEEGRPNGFLSKRPAIWAETDPARCGLLPWVFEEGFSFRRYVEWALDVPVMFVNRDGTWHALGNRSFRKFMDEGHPTLGRALHLDFYLHLTTLFPEVRVKQHAEIRGADSCSVEMIAAITALWRGILYDAAARESAFQLVAGLTNVEREALHLAVARRGPAALASARSVRELCVELVSIAADGLARLTSGSQDAACLEPLREAAESGRTAAESLLETWPIHGAAALLARI